MNVSVEYPDPVPTKWTISLDDDEMALLLWALSIAPLGSSRRLPYTNILRLLPGDGDRLTCRGAILAGGID